VALTCAGLIEWQATKLPAAIQVGLWSVSRGLLSPANLARSPLTRSGGLNRVFVLVQSARGAVALVQEASDWIVVVDE